MFSMLKKTFKFTIVTVLALGVLGLAATAIAGEHRAHAVMDEVHGRVMETIDRSIEDPAAMRTQLRELEREYPKRITQVRDDLSELQLEIRELDRDQAIAERVVELVSADLNQVEAQLASNYGGAEDGLLQVQNASWNGRAPAKNPAEMRLGQLRQQTIMYQNRAADAGRDLGYLRLQEARLQELLAKLERERSEFQSQIVGLSRQIDSIARNDRLIVLLDKRNRTIEECSRYEAVSLDQITGRLASIRSRQEAELDLLATAEAATDYEHAARMQIATETPVRQDPGLDAADFRLRTTDAR